MSTITEKLNDLIEAGWNSTLYVHHHKWSERVEAFLEKALGKEAANEFKNAWPPTYEWEVARERQIGTLEGFICLVEAERNAKTTPARSETANLIPFHAKRLFIVHGHDAEAKESVARFVERIGLEPVILHEQPNSGRTIIEKFEAYSHVGFAVVLLTPDDFCASLSDPQGRKGRARQNVILELGYFLGKLSRHRVCALYKKGVEIPSDFQGVLYVELDSAGAWRTKLAQELVEVGFSIKIEALLKS